LWRNAKAIAAVTEHLGPILVPPITWQAREILAG
jgi:hypothetical protein